MLNYYDNFYAKSFLVVAYGIFNESSIVVFIPLNEVRNLTKSFYTNIYTSCIVFFAQCGAQQAFLSRDAGFATFLDGISEYRDIGKVGF